MGFFGGNSATATFKASCEKTEADGNIRTAPVRDKGVGEDVRLHDVYELDGSQGRVPTNARVAEQV